MPTILRDGRHVHCSGEGSGPGVVLVPGIGAGARLFGTLPRRFARAGYHCVAIDPVGMPPSSPLPSADYDFTAAALDVLAVAETLPSPRTLVGTSLGGKVALRAAALANGTIDRLVLLCSAAVITERARRVYRMFERLSQSTDPTLLGDFMAPFLFGDSFLQSRPTVVDDIVRSMKPSPESRLLMLAQARALHDYDGSDDARRCTVPTLCLAGAEDTLTLPSEVAATAALLADARCEVVPAAGHSLLLESAAALARVLEFLPARGANA